MVKFCTSCGTANTADARFCARCGNAIAAAAPDAGGTVGSATSPEPAAVPIITGTERAIYTETVTIEQPQSQDRNWLLIGGAAVLIVLIALLYFWLFVWDDLGDGADPSKPEVAKTASVTAAPMQMFTMTEANIRDKATTVDSNIIGKMPRGSALSGVVKLGEDGTTDWLELAEGKGFVAAVNLSETEPPVLIKSLDDKIWSTDTAIEIWSQPDSGSTLIDRVNEGTKLTLAGLTGNDYIEIKLKKGGVGYIADGAAIIARLGGKPIVISFNPQTCNFGGELGGQFEKIGARLRAQWAALEAKEYPSDAARDKAMSSIEGRSTYERLQRSYEGLTLTAIAQHYESQSLYFADPPAKVIEVFRAKGFRIGRDGTFPATELYAGISGTRGEGTAYGKSELSCGV